MYETMRPNLSEEARLAAFHIAIDGPASAGKSTVGRLVADALACPYLDTGLMYRAITARALAAGIALSDARALGALAQTTRFAVGTDHQLQVDGVPAGIELRQPAVDAAVSAVSAHPSVRTALVDTQRALSRGRCFVMVGRDIGSVVLPEAQLKLWVTASPEVRARRRALERLGTSDESTLAELAASLRRRDEIDSSRAVSPSIPAPDATVLDTDRLSIEEVVDRVLALVDHLVGHGQA